MKNYQFPIFSDLLLRHGPAVAESDRLNLADDGVYRLQYIPFEYVNRS